MPEAVLGFGSNLGARRALIQCALELLDAQPGLRVCTRSALYETPALGPPQPDYLNAAARVSWVGTLEGLFAVTQHVELLLGRERRVRWGARTLDIDLLHWSEGAVETPELAVPHRELWNRNFALAPLLDVMPELVPVHGARLAELGGAPRRAEPGWTDLALAGPVAALPVPADLEEAELACLVVGAVRACTGQAVAARHSLPFRLPPPTTNASPQPLAHPLLLPSVAAAHHAGFRVRCAAITAFDAQGIQGFLVGEHTGVREPFAMPTLTMERVGGARLNLRVSPSRPL